MSSWPWPPSAGTLFEEITLDQHFISSIGFRVSQSKDYICQYRANVLRHWCVLADALRTKEEELHSTLHPNVEAVIGSKRILLFRAMLQDIGFEGTGELIFHMTAGSPGCW